MSEDKKMIFIKWFPDDVLNGTSMLTWQSELTYYRLINHIYTSNDNLFDDEITWQVLTAKFNGNSAPIKDELLKKNKIYIQDGKIKNKGCDKWLKEAKDNFETNSERGKRGAEVRWKKDAPSNAQALATISYKPLTINHNKYKDEVNVFNYFNEFWELVTNKVSKGQALKNYKKVDKDWLAKPKELAEMYNQHYNSLTDKTFAKQPSSWLSAMNYLDETPKELSIANKENSEFESWVDAFKNPTPFSIDYAKKHKGFVEKMVEKGMITDKDVKNLGIELL